MSVSAPFHPPWHQVQLQAQFPGLRQVSSTRLVYLDNAATTQKPQSVLDGMEHANRYLAANVRRGAYLLSAEATAAYEQVRTQVQQFLQAASPEEIVFTKGTTEALNLVANAFGSRLSAGDEVVVTAMEHHANLLPWQLLAQRQKLQIKVVGLDEHGNLDMAHFYTLLNSRTKVVAVTHVSNVLGCENPLRAIADAAHAQGAVVVVDGAQAVAHIPVDVQALGCDFYAFSAHKMYGPFGVGVLYGKRQHLECMPPWQGGGDMIEEVHFTHATYAPPPHRFEAGTPNVAGVIGLGYALNFLQTLGWDNIAAHEQQLTVAMQQTLATWPQLTVYGPWPKAHGIFSWTLDHVHAHDISTVLDSMHIAVRSGHLCAQPLLRQLGLPAVCRASLAVYNDEQDIAALADGLAACVRIFAA